MRRILTYKGKLVGLCAASALSGATFGAAEFLWQFNESSTNWDTCANWSYVGDPDPACCMPCLTTQDATIPYANGVWDVGLNDWYTIGLLDIGEDTDFARPQGALNGRLVCEQVRISGGLNGSVVNTDNGAVIATREF